MSAENTRDPALVVVLSLLGILAVTLISGLLLMQKQNNIISYPETTSVASKERVAADEFDPISWAREGAEYPPLQAMNKNEMVFSVDYNKNDIVPDTIPPKSDIVKRWPSSPTGKYSDTISPKTDVVKHWPSSPTAKDSDTIPPPSDIVKQVASITPHQVKKNHVIPDPAYREIRENAYWVQIIASKNISTAEKIRDRLSEKGLPVHVMTQNTGNKIVYRVRLGAFETRDEAENYAGTVRKLDGFSDSYITIAPVTRRLPADH